MSIGTVRFIYVPAACIHGMPWALACLECDALRDVLAKDGVTAIPRNVMAVGILVERSDGDANTGFIALPPSQPLLAG